MAAPAALCCFRRPCSKFTVRRILGFHSCVCTRKPWQGKIDRKKTCSLYTRARIRTRQETCQGTYLSDGV